jgi:predicted dehydrogenase
MIRDGVIGKVEMIMDEAAAFYNYEKRPKWFLDPVMAGGGALFNLVPHMIDHLVYLHDSPIVEVSGKTAALYPDVIVDSECTAFIRYADGATAVVSASTGNRLLEPSCLRCRVMGSKGSLLMDAFIPEVIWCHGSERIVIDCSKDPLPVDLEWSEFYDHIVNDAPLHADGNYGMHIVKILEAIRSSSESGRNIAI